MVTASHLRHPWAACAAALLGPTVVHARPALETVSCWDYLPPANTPILMADARPVSRHLNPPALSRMGNAKSAGIPPGVAPSALISIGGTGMGESVVAPSAPIARQQGESITDDASVTQELATFDPGLVTQVTLASNIGPAPASREAAHFTLVRPQIYGIMTPQIAAEVLERADRFPGESPKGMALAEVLAHNRLPRAQQASRGSLVADGTNVIGLPKGR